MLSVPLFAVVTYVESEVCQICNCAICFRHLQIGMVAWNMKLKTPECPAGRQVIVIANDITFRIGSFGYQEDLLFKVTPNIAELLCFPVLVKTCEILHLKLICCFPQVLYVYKGCLKRTYNSVCFQYVRVTDKGYHSQL